MCVGVNQVNETNLIVRIFTALQWFCLVLGICATNLDPGRSEKPNLHVQYSWGQLEFEWTPEHTREAFIASGDFVPGVPAPIDADVYYSRKRSN